MDWHTKMIKWDIDSLKVEVQALTRNQCKLTISVLTAKAAANLLQSQQFTIAWNVLISYRQSVAAQCAAEESVPDEIKDLFKILTYFLNMRI